MRVLIWAHSHSSQWGSATDETEVQKELEARGLESFYDRIVEQLSSLDQKAQAMIGLEGLLLALIAVFSSSILSISNNFAVRAATWAATVLLLSSALSSLLVLRIRWGTKIIAQSRNVDEGLVNYRQWRDHKLMLHKTALTFLAAGLLGLVIVLTIILLPWSNTDRVLRIVFKWWV
jgi:hypothetical protein